MGTESFANWYDLINQKYAQQNMSSSRSNKQSAVDDMSDPYNSYVPDYNLKMERYNNFSEMDGIIDAHLYDDYIPHSQPAYADDEYSHGSYNDIFNLGSISSQLPPQNEFKNILAGAMEGKRVSQDPEYALTQDIVYTKLDNSKNMNINLYSAAAYSIESIKKYDWNKDGNITPDEFGLNKASTQDARLFYAIDSNQDHKISQEEHLGYIIAQDDNGDAIITVDERNYFNSQPDSAIIADNAAVIKKSGIIKSVINFLNQYRSPGNEYPRKTLNDQSQWDPYTNPYYKNKKPRPKRFPFDSLDNNFGQDPVQIFAKRFGIQLKDLMTFFSEKYLSGRRPGNHY